MKMKRLNKKRGFSYIEVLLSMTIFLIAASFLLSYQGKLFSFSHNNQEREEILFIAGDIIEELKSGKDKNDITTNYDLNINIEFLNETDTYTQVYLHIEHPNVEKYDIEMEYFLLKQDVKNYD